MRARSDQPMWPCIHAQEQDDTMDQASFDRLTRLLGSSRSRRAGLASLIGALTAAAPAAGTGRKRPSPEGACGPARKDNICRKDKDCCTGICDIGLGNKNKDRKGRCRCRSNGQSCSEDRNCCGTKMICIGGVCGDPCVALGAVCTGADTCCAGTCGGPQVSTGRSGRGAPAATCCLAISESGCNAASDCCGPTGSVDCIAGVCASTCKALGAVCIVSDVCCAGACQSRNYPGVGVAGDPTICCVSVSQSGCVNAGDCCDTGAACISGVCKLPD